MPPTPRTNLRGSFSEFSRRAGPQHILNFFSGTPRFVYCFNLSPVRRLQLDKTPKKRNAKKIANFLLFEQERIVSCSNKRKFSLARAGENSLLFDQERILYCSNMRKFSPVRTSENSLLFEQERIISCSNKKKFAIFFAFRFLALYRAASVVPG